MPTSRNREHYLTAAEAAELFKERNAVLIDIRPPEKYAAKRVSGAISMSGYEIKTKGFLRGKKLLLLGDGYQYRDLERVTRELKDEGFADVFVVDGGLQAWATEVGGLAGPHGMRRAATISPSEFIRERHYDHWKLVFLGEDPAGADVGLPPIDAAISLDAEPEAIRASLSGLSGAADSGAFEPLILIVSSGGEGYALVQSAMKDTALWNLFYLEGGIRAYRGEVARVEAVRNRERRGIGAKPGGCAASR